MDKMTFNKLDIQEQIEYINIKLNQGNTLTKTAKEIGIGRSTVSDRFKKSGYIFDKKVNNYICNTEVIIVNNKELKKNYKSNDDNKLQKYDESNYYQEITKVITEFQEMKNQLNEVYEWYSKEKNVIDPVELKIEKFEGEPTNRTYKIYPKVQKQFKKFCEEHKKYKVQDIISQALLEFMQRYD